MTRLQSGSAGPRGQLRATALVALREQRRRPGPREGGRNAQQLAELLDLDYTSIRHHLRVLLKNQVVVTSGPRYGQVYFLSPATESHWDDLERILEKFRKKNEG